MMIKLEIPIWYLGAPHIQDLYFYSVNGDGLTRNCVFKEVSILHNRDKQFPEYANDWYYCLDTLTKVKDWKYLDNNTPIATSIITLADGKEYPFTWKKIIPIVVL